MVIGYREVLVTGVSAYLNWPIDIWEQCHAKFPFAPLDYSPNPDAKLQQRQCYFRVTLEDKHLEYDLYLKCEIIYCLVIFF